MVTSDRIGSEGGGVSDPTALTTDQLLRELGNLEKLIVMQLGGLERVVNEKFNAVNIRFDLMEGQRIELKTDTKTAVDAALQAAKELGEKQNTAFSASIEKSESSQVRQFEQISSNFKTEIASIGGTLSDIKERLTTIESIKRGGEEINVATRAGRDDHRANINVIVGVAGLIIAAAIFALSAVLGR